MLLIGLITGISTGLTGASGVTIVVPLLTLFLSFSVHSAIGTSLVVDVVASLVVVYTYFRHGNIELQSGIWVLVGSVTGAQIGAIIASNLPEAGLGIGFGVGMVLMGIVIWRRSRKTTPENTTSDSGSLSKPNQVQIIKAILIGIGIGLLTGIMGAGGGMMILLALILILKFPLHKAIGTSTLIMAMTALSGVFGYAIHGEIDFVAGIVVGLGAIVGGWLSARLANNFSEHRLGQVAGSFFILLGVVMTAILASGRLMLI